MYWKYYVGNKMKVLLCTHINIVHHLVFLPVNHPNINPRKEEIPKDEITQRNKTQGSLLKNHLAKISQLNR